MNDTRYARAFQAAIAETLARIQTERQAAAPASEAYPGRRGLRGAPPVSETAPADVSEPAKAAARQITEQLDERVERLSLVSEWIKSDPEFTRLIDAAIGGQVRTAERRLARLSVALTLVSLIAGWLLSLAGSPAALFGR